MIICCSRIAFTSFPKCLISISILVLHLVLHPTQLSITRDRRLTAGRRATFLYICRATRGAKRRRRRQSALQMHLASQMQLAMRVASGPIGTRPHGEAIVYSVFSWTLPGAPLGGRDSSLDINANDDDDDACMHACTCPQGRGSQYLREETTECAADVGRLPKSRILNECALKALRVVRIACSLDT